MHPVQQLRVPGGTRGLDLHACTMHNACMATKTISLKLDAYEKLRAARRQPTESFSQVILRARWPEETIVRSTSSIATCW